MRNTTVKRRHLSRQNRKIINLRYMNWKIIKKCAKKNQTERRRLATFMSFLTLPNLMEGLLNLLLKS